jgi:pseudaminic acid cytidylyltransferase
MKSIAIITARGGSKRIPRKNIKIFLGKPIIAYSIEAALGAGCFEEVMVSTDDAEIAEIAQKLGAKVPFIRSAKASNDYSTTAEVLIEVLKDYQKIGQFFQNACCIYPTAPFVSASKLKEAYKLLISSDTDSVLPVTEFSFPILRSFKMDAQSKVSFNWPENALKRSQDLPKSYHDCGQFYFFNTERFLASQKLVTHNTAAIVMPNTEVQDIDNQEDWTLAEIKYSFLHKK